MPTRSAKWRPNVRRLIPARAARSAIVSGSARWRTAHSSTGANASPLAGTGAGMYCACPPSRCGATTIRRPTSAATAAPKSVRTMCRHRSTLAAVPALVSTEPSSTHSGCSSTVTAG
jgi:hypothetical protein